ncbi:MAG: cysteine synthase A [Prolixibacteraceae bacterium]|nr:cysteine synthase A [Prolixibacteraceae bacterium]
MGNINNIIQHIGKTPLIQLQRMAAGTVANVLLKMESFNPGGSVKDRLALAMIDAAEKDGKINPGTVIIEPTSGNTGIGLAMICAVKGYKLIIVMPESVSAERRIILRAYGAELHLTPAAGGMKEAIQKAYELANDLPDAFIPMQFENKANAEFHRRTTGPEIWEDTKGGVDIFIAGAGTGGTITGVTDFLKTKKPDLHSVVVEPTDSPVIAGGKPGSHKIQGIGPGFIPGVLKRDIIDEIFHVENEKAFEYARRLAIEEGILAGISSGANVYAALEIAKRPQNSGKTIVTVICDTGERYLSTPLFNSDDTI